MAVEGQPQDGQAVPMRDLDAFHVMVNLESHPEFLPTAKRLAEGFLAAARERQRGLTLEQLLRPFTYTREAFRARLDDIYVGLAHDVERYEAQQSWSMRSRDDVIEWMRQMAPFNQTDGSWLRNIAPVGPLDEVRSLLFRIWIEELGNGDPGLNHPNLYTELLESVGIALPPIRSREYAEDPAFLDSAFTRPLFQLVVSQFSGEYFPELLGMTQYLEWSSVELKNMVRLNEHFGLATKFYEVHVAIDNAATGHGAMARRAIELHLERVRLDVGEQAMQEEWARVWDGYVAFATTGTLAADMHRRRLTPVAPAERVEAIIRDRAAIARLNHGHRTLGGALINDLFADPPAMMTALVSGGMIRPGDPEASPFFTLVTSDGPMFQIFDADELATWRSWTQSLAPAATGGTPAPEPVATTTGSAATAMRVLVDAMRGRQSGIPAHLAAPLTGPDPAQPERSITHPVAWWFDQPTSALMAALGADVTWVTPGDPDASPFLTALAAGGGPMATALGAPVAAADGRAGTDIVAGWIRAGCPVTDDAPVRPLSLLSPADRVANHPTGLLHGSGSVH